MKKFVFGLVIVLITLSVSACSLKKDTTTNEGAITPKEEGVTPNSATQDEDTNLIDDQKATTTATSTLVQETKSYQNEKYAYQINYPKNWYVDTTYSDKDFSLRGGNDSIGGDTIFSNYQNPTKFNPSTLPKDLREITLMIYQFDKNKTLVDFYNSKNFGGNYINITINGQEALKITKNCSNTILLKKDDKIYDISYTEYKCGTPGEEDLIMQSFKFIQ